MTREEAITVLNMVEAHGPLVIKAKEMAIEALKQPEQKKAKWKDHICTNCETFMPPLQLMFAGKILWQLSTINYCPNCGAKMEE